MLMRVRLGVGVHRRRGAALAVHPPRIAVHIVLFLPNRYAVFDLIDDVPAGAEGLVPMARAYANPHSHVANGEVTDAVDAGRVFHFESRDGLGEDALAFLDRKRLERLVFKVANLHALVVIAHEPFERAIAAAGRIGKFRPQGRLIDGLVTEAEPVHSTSGHGRDEHHRVTVSQWLRPLPEFRIHGYPQHFGSQSEGIARFQLFVELSRRLRAGDQGFIAFARLLTQQRVVLNLDVLANRRVTFRAWRGFRIQV